MALIQHDGHQEGGSDQNDERPPVGPLEDLLELPHPRPSPVSSRLAVEATRSRRRGRPGTLTVGADACESSDRARRLCRAERRNGEHHVDAHAPPARLASAPRPQRARAAWPRPRPWSRPPAEAGPLIATVSIPQAAWEQNLTDMLQQVAELRGLADGQKDRRLRKKMVRRLDALQAQLQGMKDELRGSSPTGLGGLSVVAPTGTPGVVAVIEEPAPPAPPEEQDPEAMPEAAFQRLLSSLEKHSFADDKMRVVAEGGDDEPLPRGSGASHPERVLVRQRIDSRPSRRWRRRSSTRRTTSSSTSRSPSTPRRRRPAASCRGATDASSRHRRQRLPRSPRLRRPPAGRPRARGARPARHVPRPELQKRDIPFVEGDVTEPAQLEPALRDVDAVLHLAAIARDWGDAALFERVNAGGTRKVLEASLARGASRFVLMSSVAVHAYRDHDDTTEDAPRDGGTFPYGETKIAAEDMVLEAHAQGRITGVVVRPGLVPFGPGDRAVLPPLRPQSGATPHAPRGRGPAPPLRLLRGEPGRRRSYSRRPTRPPRARLSCSPTTRS